MDLRKQQEMAHRLVHAKFQQGWQWKISIRNCPIKVPQNLDMYAKSVEHGGFTIEYEPYQVGSLQFNQPQHKTASDITLIIRDDEDSRFENFLGDLAALVVNPNGTVNLPKDYLFTLVLDKLLDDGSEVPYKEWKVSIGNYGGFNRARDAIGEFVSFTAVFQKHASY